MPEHIAQVGKQIRLVKGSVPSIFLTGDDSTHSIEVEPHCDNCDDIESEKIELIAKLSKLSLDSQIHELRLSNKIEKLESVLEEKTTKIEKLQRQLRSFEIKYKRLEDQLFISKSTPDIQVLLLSC